MSEEPPDLSLDSAAIRVCKHPIPLRAAFATADGVCETLEGPVRYRAGDAILTGVHGERWPVRRDTFLAGYEPIPPTREAEDGAYRKRPSVSLARRLDGPARVPVGWQKDPLQARSGDWLLQYADGSRGVLQDAIFRATYGPAPDETRWPPSE